MRWRHITLLCLACSFLIIGGLCWYADAVWLPTHGRLWLTRRLAEHCKADVTLQELGFHPLEGFILKELLLTDASTRRVLVRISSAHGMVNPWPLLARQSLHVHATLRMEDPGPATITASGRYELHDGALAIDVTTQPLVIAQLGPGARRWLPPDVRAGTAIVHAHAERGSAQPFRLTGTADVTDALIEHAPYRVRGRAHLDGTAQRDGVAWHWQLAVQPTDAAIEGLPRLGTVTALAGTVQVRDFDVTAMDLTGLSHGIRAHVTGSITDARQPNANIVITAQGPVSAFHSLVPSWAAKARLDDGMPASLQAHVRCEQAQRRCIIDELTGTAQAMTITLQGAVGLDDPFPSTLTLTVTAPLAGLAPWLPPPFKTLAWTGSGTVTATLEGALREQLTPTHAEADVRDGGVHLPAPLPSMQHMTGRLIFDDDTLSTPGLQLTVFDNTCTLTGTVEHVRLEDVPEISLHLASPRLTANLDAQLDEHDLHVHLLEGRYLGSTFRAIGDLLNLPHPTANLFVKSTLDLADLPTLPVPPGWKDFLTAHAASGTALIDATFQGPFDPSWSTGRLGLKISSPQCALGRVLLQDVTAEAHLEDGQLRVPAFAAGYAGGQLQGHGSLDVTTPTPAFNLQWTAAQINLAQALQPWHPAQPIVGTLDTSWALTGEGQQWQRLRGTGTVRAEGENLGTVPVLNRILGGLGGIVADYLRMGQLRRVTFKQAEGRFTIADGRVTTQDLTFRGEAMGCTAEGGVDFNGQLDVLVIPSVMQAIAQQSPVLGQAAGKISQFDTLALGRVHIGGTLEEPQFTSKLAPADQLLQQLLPDQVRDVLHGLQDILRR